MRTTIAVLMLTAIAALASAHPGSGLEVDADGNVYLSDIFRRTVWRIDPQGGAHAHLEGVWSHEFFLNADGDLVYEKEHEGTPAPQSLNIVTAEGEQRRVIAPERDLERFGGTAIWMNDDGGVIFTHFVRGEGNVWYAVVRERETSGPDADRVRTIAGATSGEMYLDGPADRATFRMLMDMRRDAEGNLWLLDRDRIRVLSSDGVVRTHGPSLIEDDPKNPPFRNGPHTTWNRLYGLALGAEGEVYVGYFAGRCVHRVSATGELSTAHRSEEGWAPVGVAVSSDGSLFVSEASDRGQNLRVVVVGAQGHEVLVTLPDGR